MKYLKRALFVLICTALLLTSIGTTPAYAAGIVVNSNLDDTLANLNANATCDLREAIINANADNQSGSTDCPAGSGDDVITFFADYTITLNSQLDSINDTLVINGDGANNTIIQANANPDTATYRVFQVTNIGSLTLNNLTVRNGKCNGLCTVTAHSGGGIYTEGTLIINDSVISGNYVSAGGSGGGIYNDGGNVTINRSLFSDNQSYNAGGAILNDGAMTITNSTITNNTATNNAAGGIVNYGPLSIYNSTISGNISNSALVDGANIYVNTFGGDTELHLFNTIIANGINDGDCDFDSGATITATNTLIEDASTACGFTNGVNGNIIGSDPNLGSLTGTPGYFPLNTGSLAINAGDNAICAAAPVNNQSQNGVTRPEGTACDIGSFEHPDATPPTVTSITRASTSPTSASSVNFTVAFSENVTGVAVVDFSLTTTGVSGASVTSVSGSNSTYTVSVNTGSGNGTIRLDVPNSATITDAFSNALSGLPFNTGEIYIVVKSPTFADVPETYWAFPWIERLYAAGLTGGCTTSPLNYCPTLPVTRAEMAVFLERGLHGNSFTPPNVPATFGDTTGHWAEDWIEALKADGITGGCGGGNYCPNAPVTRAEMAVFLLRVMHSASYTPPNHAPTFGDSAGHWAEDWIEQLALEGITSGCGGGNYCPNSPATREQMAVFLVKAFDLP